MTYFAPLYAIPSANPALCRLNVIQWVRKGYSVHILVDNLTDEWQDVCRELIAARPVGRDQCQRISVMSLATFRFVAYPGYYVTVNTLSKTALLADPDLKVVVTGGDDMLPDPALTADEAQDLYLKHYPRTDGVMQPVGDDMDGTDRICGSPWLGREWCLRGYNGRGAFWPEYHSFYGDEELLNVAKLQGRLTQEPAMNQRHEHWSRADSANHMKKQPYHDRNQERWEKDKAIFTKRQADGFPQCHLSPVSVNR